MLIDICLGQYEEFVVYERNQKDLYVQIMKEIHLHKVSILYFTKFRTDIESIWYLVNSYAACEANKIINGKQYTLNWHVDDVKASHADATVNDKFRKWCENKYGNENLGHVTVVRGDKHDDLAIHLDYSDKDKLKIDMKYYIDNMDEEFPYDNSYHYYSMERETI